MPGGLLSSGEFLVDDTDGLTAGGVFVNASEPAVAPETQTTIPGVHGEYAPSVQPGPVVRRWG